jgi:hypothetical protein
MTAVVSLNTFGFFFVEINRAASTFCALTASGGASSTKVISNVQLSGNAMAKSSALSSALHLP